MTKLEQQSIRFAIGELTERRNAYFKKGNPHANVLGNHTEQAINVLEKLLAREQEAA